MRLDVRAAPGPGVLRRCCPGGDGAGAPDADAAGLQHRLRSEIAARLRASVPDGWEVSAGCCWHPSPGPGTLHPDVAVHRALADEGRLQGAPVLCVDVSDEPAGPRPARAYARLGVDHHWHVDTRRGTVQVSVRVDADYRRCETFSSDSSDSSDSSATRSAPAGSAWVDFGVGIVHLDGLLLPTTLTTRPSG
ncbi:Uma2 family endonuclease [Microlunatus spumicola]|uniref:Uma2 family endonuclease n=1 Tax=Microlunatus spumicola TaxID=81499 RepID=UPI00195791C4